MDAQNAAESDPPPKHPGASSLQHDKQQDRLRHGSGSDHDRKSPLSLRPSSPSKDSKFKSNLSLSSNSSSSVRSSDNAMLADRDSDAETIVLPGKDGHSPSKARKVRQEDKSESDGDVGKGNGRSNPSTNHGDKYAAGNRPGPGEGIKKKRMSGSIDKERLSRNKDGASSGLSSAPASPPHGLGQHRPLPHQSQSHSQSQHQHLRRRSDAAATSQSDSEESHHHNTSKLASSKSSLREKLRPGERLLPNKRKAPKAESDDEADPRKARRQRTASVNLDNGRVYKDTKSISSRSSHHDSRNRSISPPQRAHRRSISTQLPFQNSSSLKKKRIPHPLQPADYNSDDSSASGSPHPRSTKLRGLATPAAVDSHASPAAKMAPHKKHLDAHGQTQLARACARGDYPAAKMRLNERPEDLNVADYAGNTPLQIAALNGCADIVKLLIDAGCNLDCVNYDKETPLLDAVDNGHVEVVKLLLDAGVNPRKANVNGEEPIDRVNEDEDTGEEIRNLLLAAKKRAGERRRTSEERHLNDSHEGRDSHAPDSPRHSPAGTVPGASGRRSGTVRSTKTRNDLLYMPLDEKTLRQAAGRGDEETVARVLQVKEGFDDPESMVAAARGGHDLVIQLLLGLGSANPDPAPVRSLQHEFATPILAAIGQENIKVVELLLEQQGFDPTRRFKGETYYEIARRRQGSNWKDEEQLLKNAYDEYKRNHKDLGKTKSPVGRRDRERDREEKRARQENSKDEPRIHKRTALSPSRDAEPKKKSSANRLPGSPKEKKRPNPLAAQIDDGSQKRGPGRPKKELPSQISDREVSPTAPLKQNKPKRTESDLAGVSSDGEAVKPRRKLISKGELKGERERQKRGSMTSTSSTMKEPSSPAESRNEEPTEKPKLSEKYHDRTKALKRDDSRDRVSMSDGSTKRHRSSLTPDRPSDGDRENAEAPIKKRRLDADLQEKKLSKRALSPDGKPRKPTVIREASSKSTMGIARRAREDDSKSASDERDLHRKESSKINNGDKSIRVKSEDVDTDMGNTVPLKEIPEARERKAREEEELARKKELAEKEEARKEEARKEEARREEARREEARREEARKEEMRKEEERRRVRAEEKRKRELEEVRQREEEEKRRKEQEEREAQKKREEEEAQRLREKAERERREAEEAARREAEEKRRLEEEERERERKRKEEEERLKKEEEERRHREEEERLRREQLEREAAEEARRKKEEEERLRLEEMERQRIARERELQRIREEEERARVAKLPPPLRWLSLAAEPKTPTIAKKFQYMLGIRYDTINPKANNTPEGREQWVLSMDVALLFGDKDIQLSQYSTWEHVPASTLAKKCMWRTEWQRYSFLLEKHWELGQQLPDYYPNNQPTELNFNIRQQMKQAAEKQFLDTEMFFVKVSDVMHVVPNISHLRNIELVVGYKELAEDDAQYKKLMSSSKWKNDPDVSGNGGFAPRNKVYINGVLSREEKPVTHDVSQMPFPEPKVPRRGLVQVLPDDPEYDKICLEQGLQHLVLKDNHSPAMLNGVYSSPTSQKSSIPPKPIINGANGHVGKEDQPVLKTMTNDVSHAVNGTMN